MTRPCRHITRDGDRCGAPSVTPKDRCDEHRGMNAHEHVDPAELDPPDLRMPNGSGEWRGLVTGLSV